MESNLNKLVEVFKSKLSENGIKFESEEHYGEIFLILKDCHGFEIGLNELKYYSPILEKQKEISGIVFIDLDTHLVDGRLDEVEFFGPFKNNHDLLEFDKNKIESFKNKIPLSNPGDYCVNLSNGSENYDKVISILKQINPNFLEFDDENGLQLIAFQTINKIENLNLD